MTKNAGRKKRIRELMEQTGLHYTAARKLLEDEHGKTESQGTQGNPEGTLRQDEARKP